MRYRFALFIVLLSSLCSCRSGNHENTKAPQTPREVVTFVAQKSQYVVPQRYFAEIKGRQDVDIIAQVSGKIQKVCISEGQEVKKGQTLFVIDQAPYIASKQMALANVNSAEALLRTQKMNLEAKEALLKENVISQFDYEQANNAFLQARAALDQAKASLQKAHTDLGYTTVNSPCDGVAGMIPFREGTLVGPQTAMPLTKVADTKVMFVYFSLGQVRYRELISEYGSKDNLVKNSPELVLILNDGSEYQQKGKIEAVSGVLDQTTGTVSFRASFPNAEGLLLSGSKGNIIIPRIVEDVCVVPQSAVFEIQGKYFVQKIENSIATTVEVHALEEGNIQDATSFIIRSGLEEGDVIAAENSGLIKNGETVTVCQQNSL